MMSACVSECNAMLNRLSYLEAAGSPAGHVVVLLVASYQRA